MESGLIASEARVRADACTSVSVLISPEDSRRRYWAKLVRSDTALPIPSLVSGAADIPGGYLRRGEEEMYPGDVLIEGEANHHRRTDRGWTYWVTYVTEEGEMICFRSGFGEQKAKAKAQGLAAPLLAGSGDIAGAVRVGHALRMGLNL